MAGGTSSVGVKVGKPTRLKTSTTSVKPVQKPKSPKTSETSVLSDSGETAATGSGGKKRLTSGQIQRCINRKLAKSERFAGQPVSVEMVLSTAKLSGTVRSVEDQEALIRLCRKCGASFVENQLVVGGGASPEEAKPQNPQ